MKAETAWERVALILIENYDNPDIEAAKVLYAAVTAHRLTKYPPAWELLIAPSGSMKTDLLESLRGLPRVHFVDEVTGSTFLSGKVDEPGTKRKTPASLLHRLGNDGILIAADFSTLTALDGKALAKILSQLRRIFDGNYCREFGTSENAEERTWTGRITVLAGGTPDLDRQYAVFQSLGERFIRVRWPRAGGVEAGLRALQHTHQLAPLLKAAVHEMLLPVLAAPEAGIVVPHLPPEMELRIAHLSELVALARISVHRERGTREVTAEPVAEGNTRLPQQLAQIGRGWALLCGRETVGAEDFTLIKRAAFDCLPPARREVLEALSKNINPYSLGRPSVSVSRAVEDLEYGGLVESALGTARLTLKTKDLLAGVGLSSLNLPNKTEEEWVSCMAEIGGK